MLAVSGVPNSSTPAVPITVTAFEFAAEVDTEESVAPLAPPVLVELATSPVVLVSVSKVGVIGRNANFRILFASMVADNIESPSHDSTAAASDDEQNWEGTKFGVASRSTSGRCSVTYFGFDLSNKKPNILI